MLIGQPYTHVHEPQLHGIYFILLEMMLFTLRYLRANGGFHSFITPLRWISPFRIRGLPFVIPSDRSRPDLTVRGEVSNHEQPRPNLEWRCSPFDTQGERRFSLFHHAIALDLPIQGFGAYRL